MNALLWTLQIVAAVLYLPAGLFKVFFCERMSRDFPSMKALPPRVWRAVGAIEVMCAAGLVLPAALNYLPSLTVVAAAFLAAESLALVASCIKYREVAAILGSALPGAVMLFLLYGRLVLQPI